MNTQSCLYRWVSHKIGVTFYRIRKLLFLLVEPCDISGNNQSLKSLFIINSENIWSGSQNMGFVFHKLHITESIVGVPDNLVYLQKVLKIYTVKQSLQTTVRGTDPVREVIFIRPQRNFVNNEKSMCLRKTRIGRMYHNVFPNNHFA